MPCLRSFVRADHDRPTLRLILLSTAVSGAVARSQGIISGAELTAVFGNLADVH